MVEVTAPMRSADQRLTALQRANAVRQARAALKQNLKDGVADAANVIGDPAPEFATMKVSALLTALPRYGPVRVQQIMRHCQISDSKTLGGLSDRQRLALLDVLRWPAR